MKFKTLMLFIATVFGAMLANATVLRVGYTTLYNTSPLAGVDFNNLVDANNAAQPGDTIQIYGSVSGGDLTKRLVILGFGYNLDVHPGLQTNANSVDAPSLLDALFFGPGCDGSVVKGITCSLSFQCGDYYETGTPVSNITFERCYGSFYLYNSHGGALSNVRIIDCICSQIAMYNGDNGVPLNNLQVFNSICNYVLLYNSATTASIINCVSWPSTYGHISFNNAQVLLKNSVIYAPASGSNTVYQNNFIYSSEFALPPGSSNNHWDVGFDDIFEELGVPSSYNTGTPGYNEFNENWYILKAGSPAINAGTNADNSITNCGIFGGEAGYIYKPGGIPSIPAIYQLTAPGSEVSSNPYNIIVSVRGNN